MTKRILYFLCFLIGTSLFYINNKYNVLSSYGFGKKTLTVKLINHAGSKTVRGIINDILQERYNIKISNKNYDMIFDTGYCENGICEQVNSESSHIIKIFYTLEADRRPLDQYDLNIGFEHINDPRYFRLPFYYMGKYSTQISTNYDRAKNLGVCKPNKPYFACFLVSNPGGGDGRDHHPLDGCIARNSVFHKLSTYKRVESGGAYLNNIGKKIHKNEMMSWMSQCKFVISYENQTSFDGYITEKPFQAYFAGAIPIYYGNKIATHDLNPNAIIDAKSFKNEDELLEHIKKVDNDDSLYCDIWNQNIIVNPNLNFDLVKNQLRKKIFELLDRKFEFSHQKQ